MQLEHSFSVPVGIDEAWKVLLDVEQIGPCMPGATVDSVDGDDFTGSVKVKLGPINLTYKGKASFVEKDEAAHRVKIDARGRDARGNGTAAAKVTAMLTEAGSDSTDVKVNTDLDITGKPAQFGRGVMVDVGNKLIGQFADRLAAQLSSSGEGSQDSTASGAAATAPQPSTTSTSASPASTTSTSTTSSGTSAPPNGGTTATTGTASNGSAAASSATAGAGAGPGASTAPAHSATSQSPEADVEPIDLLGSAGPAVAKRLAPVAAVLVILLAVLGRRRCSKRHESQQD